MRRFVAIPLLTVVALLGLGAGVVYAADVQVTPSDVDEGVQQLTIEVSDFGADTAIWVVPCMVPESGDPADVTPDSCSIADVVTATTDASGAATVEVTWDVPAEGVAVYVGDEMRTQQATQILTPAGTQPTTTEAPGGDDAPTTTAAVEVLGTSVQEDELADTGPGEVAVLAGAAAVLMALGGATVGTSRRLARAHVR